MSRLQVSHRSVTRFGLFIFSVVLIVLTGTGFAQDSKITASDDGQTLSWRKPHNPDSVEPYWGEHQGGIVTAPQHHLYFAAFDIVTSNRDDVVKLLQAWTAAAARMSEGETALPLESGLKLAVTPAATKGDEDEKPDPSTMAADTGEATGMSPSRLTITFGFGPSLFIKDGKDRFGLAAQRPEALVDMPVFNGDQMAEGRTGGDISIQACAEDPQIAFHAVRQLARIAEGVARIRWVQIGYRPSRGERHLLGFSNGKGNPNVDDTEAMAQSVWVGNEGPGWMRGGSYAVVRRIRFAVEHWDQMPVAFQEKAIGETKHAGMQTSKPEIPAIRNEDEDAGITHLRIVEPGAKTILRRSYSYNDGVNFTTERWPPWRQGLEYDAGMFFICYQRDPRTGFIPMFGKMAKNDFLLNQFWTHEGGGLFAYPRGPKKGEYVGQRLFESR